MAVLNKDALIKLAKEHALLGTDWDEDNFEPSSYDLRIGTIFKNGTIYSKDHTFETFIVLEPSEIVTILTLEEVKIPHDCSGTVFAKNSRSSSGLLILNPGHVDPGFNGPLTICAINLSKEKKYLKFKQKLFTLIVSELNTEVPQEHQFVNKKEVPRKDLEFLYLDQKFKKFSNSIFDLILSNESNQLIEKVHEQLQKKRADALVKNYWAIWGIIITVVIGIFAYGFDVFGAYDEEPEVNLNYLLQENQELQKKYDKLIMEVEKINQSSEQLQEAELFSQDSTRVKSAE